QAGGEGDRAAAGQIGTGHGVAQGAGAAVGGAGDHEVLHLEGADVHGAIDDPGEAALVGGQRLAGGPVHGQGGVAGVDGRAPGQRRIGEGGAAVVLQRAQPRVPPDQVVPPVRAGAKDVRPIVPSRIASDDRVRQAQHPNIYAIIKVVDAAAVAAGGVAGE